MRVQHAFEPQRQVREVWQESERLGPCPISLQRCRQLNDIAQLYKVCPVTVLDL